MWFPSRRAHLSPSGYTLNRGQRQVLVRPQPYTHVLRRAGFFCTEACYTQGLPYLDANRRQGRRTMPVFCSRLNGTHEPRLGVYRLKHTSRKEATPRGVRKFLILTLISHLAENGDELGGLGGALYAGSGSTTSFERRTIMNLNEGSNGGAMYNLGSITLESAGFLRGNKALVRGYINSAPPREGRQRRPVTSCPPTDATRWWASSVFYNQTPSTLYSLSLENQLRLR